LAAVVIVDTDVLIDFARGDAQANSILQGLSEESSLAISVVTHMELVVGCRNNRELAELDTFVSAFQVFSLSQQVSDSALSLLKQYRLSHGLLIPDALIGATAITINANLLSKNQRDFRYIPDLNLLPYPSVP
jgi:predicted nucleic acid-binding protein